MVPALFCRPYVAHLRYITVVPSSTSHRTYSVASNAKGTVTW